MGGAITWRGVVVCECMPELLDSLAAGTPRTPILTPTQGSYTGAVAASAQTHAGGGAIDISISGWTTAQIWDALTQARRRGLVLWHRTPAQGFTPHMHGVVDGCPHLSGLRNPVLGTAAWQVREYHAGRNGLAGRGADDGPRAYVGTTWADFVDDNMEDNMDWNDGLPSVKDAHGRVVGPASAADYLTSARAFAGDAATSSAEALAASRDLAAKVDALAVKVDALAARPGVSVDAQAVADALLRAVIAKG